MIKTRATPKLGLAAGMSSEQASKVAHGNVIAAFDFAQDLSRAKSVSDVMELASAHASARYDALAAQTKELSELSRTFVTEIAKPINTRIANARKGAV